MWRPLSKRSSVAAAVASTAALAAVALAAGAHAAAETPPFNLEVILGNIGDGKGFGHVTFRQRNDDSKVVLLDTWVRDLAPNHSYRLQRAVDQTLDGDCTSTAWLTLGRGLEAREIATDDRGTGREDLFRSVAALPTGSQFDIHFQVIDAMTSAPVLQSGCYRYTVRGR
jgi:hypothetical protein